MYVLYANIVFKFIKIKNNRQVATCKKKLNERDKIKPFQTVMISMITKFLHLHLVFCHCKSTSVDGIFDADYEIGLSQNVIFNC